MEKKTLTSHTPDSFPSLTSLFRPSLRLSFDAVSFVSNCSSHFVMVEFIIASISALFPSWSLDSLALVFSRLDFRSFFSFSSACILASTDAMSMLDPFMAAFRICD